MFQTPENNAWNSYLQAQSISIMSNPMSLAIKLIQGCVISLIFPIERTKGEIQRTMCASMWLNDAR